MNLLYRLAPFPAGVGGTLLLAYAVATASRGVKFAVATLGVFVMALGFSWYNRWLMRKAVGAAPSVGRRDKVVGHVLALAGALTLGWGFAINSKLLMAGSFVFLWFSDDKLAPGVIPLSPKTARIPAPPVGELTSGEQKFLEKLVPERAANPEAGVVWGGKVIADRLLGHLKRAGSADFETALCTLGAHAGHACQTMLRDRARGAGLPEHALLIVVKTNEGASYFFGDPLNQVLAEAEVSVWSLMSSAAKEAGCKELPDVGEMFAHVTASIGGAGFGRPRVGKPHEPKRPPIELLKAYWADLAPVAAKFSAAPEHVPLLFAAAVQELIRNGKGLVPPKTALILAMESAIAMSKVDLQAARGR